MNNFGSKRTEEEKQSLKRKSFGMRAKIGREESAIKPIEIPRHFISGKIVSQNVKLPKNQSLGPKIPFIAKSPHVEIESLKVYVYLDTNDAVTALKAVKSVEKMLTDSGSTKVELGDVERGSVLVSIKGFFARTKEPDLREKVKRKGAEYGAYGEQALKDATTNERRARISQVNAQTVAIYLQSVADLPNAAIFAGEILILKITNPVTRVPAVEVVTLTVPEMQMLERNRALLSEPRTLLNRLHVLMAAERVEQEHASRQLEG